MALRDPDAAIVAVFKRDSVKNELKSKEAGREIHDDREIVELRYPGSKNWSAHIATDFSHWAQDPVTGEQVKVTYAERFAHQYQQFKAHIAQTKAGTPLSTVTFMTEARRAELRALNIYTVEALVAIDGQELKNLGPNGRDLKNKAIAFIEESKANAPALQMEAELEAMRLRNQLLEEDNRRMKELLPAVATNPDENFEQMSLDQLRNYIAVHTGLPPQGAVNRKTLIRMARDAATEKAA